MGEASLWSDGAVLMLPDGMEQGMARPGTQDCRSDSADAADMADKAFSQVRPGRSPLSILVANKSAVFGFVLVLIWIVFAVLAPVVAPQGYVAVEIKYRLESPSRDHLFGTDRLGRDVFARVIYGGRISIPSGVLVVLAVVVIGSVWGAVAGYFGGMLDEGMMRVCDIILGFPQLVLALAVATVLGPSLINSMISIAVVWWPQYARLVRSITLVEKEKEYVVAAQAVGASHGRILLRHVLPNMTGPLVVTATMDVANGIVLTAALSFLGLGVQPPTPEWGAMISQGRGLLEQWWLSFFPGLALCTAALGFNFLGDGVRDALDPRMR
jgi:peptide/nickel transport system permease protein